MNDKEKGNIATQFKMGNRFWEARSSHGRKPIWNNPNQMLEACIEYFEWVESNPLYDTKAVVVQNEVFNAPIPKMRAMTIDGLCLFLGIGKKTWNDYQHKSDFSQVVELVESTMYAQKFTGAASGLLNANIIARDLGLRDVSGVKLDAPQGVVFNLNYKGE